MKGGLTLRKMSSLSMGDNMQFEASRRPCGVAVLFKVAILNMNLKLRHCFVTRDMFHARKCSYTCMFHFWGLHQTA